MKEEFKSVNFRSLSVKLINSCIEIVEKYQAQGLRLTLRQLYYQLVTQNIIPNQEKSYKNLSGVVSDARLAGLIDWDAIEDRVRVPWMPNEYKDLNELVNAALHSYRLPRWEDQDNYIELWVEKDALAGVLRPLAHQYHVTMMVNRGYSSQSAMYEASKRYLDHDTKDCYLLYLGDLDPSGEDMVRDIKDRLVMFGINDLHVEKLALTMPQVQQYNPPPNPAKMSDPRAQEYIEKHGASSWEVDALPPNILQEIITDRLEELVDPDLMLEVKKQEEADKKLLKNTVKKLVKKEKK